MLVLQLGGRVINCALLARMKNRRISKLFVPINLIKSLSVLQWEQMDIIDGSLEKKSLEKDFSYFKNPSTGVGKSFVSHFFLKKDFKI